MPLLEIERLSVNYGAIQAVRDLSLHVDEGEIVTLIGANGAGKGQGSAMKGIFGGKENGAAGHGAPEGLVLTAEEIKDIVSCTGLWLIVREGFGGVGRVSRKGDGGWRIR